ncbi:hypothetical protein ACIBCM_19475 [Streptomyces sp. NPDC051018]|uniref:hypothetical protein n=1 Tax=Streptomyces sp. NPDC051018 TaxID=3365639 RepID=UPI00379081A9
MVSSPHEAMHRIFQEYPELFTGVSRLLGLTLPAPTTATVLPTDLTEAKPVERRVDTLLRFGTENEGAFLLAVEAQGKKDPSKPGSWAYYLTYLYEKYRVPPMLLVVCQDRTTAEWASRPVRIGLPQWDSVVLRPLVAGPHNMPVITDAAEAGKDLALATLSAITHAADPDVGAILRALSTALRDTPETVADPIVELTAQGLGKRPAAQEWRNLVAVDLSFYKSPLSEEIRNEGRAQSILTVLKARGIDITDETRTRIAESTDPELLDQWLARAALADSADDVFTTP